jgi:uncharacterized protein
MSRRSVPAVLGTLVAALGIGAAAATPLAAQAEERGAFVVIAGVDTFAVERFTRTPARLEGELTGAALGRLLWSAEPGPAATMEVLRLRAWRPGADPDAEPFQQVELRIVGDSAIVQITTPTGTTMQRLATRAGAMVYLNPSFAQVEQIVMRAAALGREPVTIPLLLVQGGQTLDAVVSFIGSDSASVAIAGTEMRVAVDGAGRLTGGAVPAQNITFRRVADARPAATGAPPPDYSAPADATYTAEEVVIQTLAGHRLVGTLTRPRTSRRVPAVVTITGSGAQDRDSAIPVLPGYRPFRDIADTLSRRGIAVLRLDDRGTGASTGDFSAATSADFADDIRAALDYLRGRRDIDPRRLGLVGHSEGGMIAPMIAATDPSLRAIALIAGPARTGREIIEFQQRQAIELNPAIPAAARDSAYASVMERFYAGAGQAPWVRYFLDHDPLATARRVSRTPVLVLHGETDRQVTVDQAAELAAAFREAGNRGVTVVALPDVNHLLLRDPDGNPAGYSTIADRAVVPEARGALADWLARTLR